MGKDPYGGLPPPPGSWWTEQGGHASAEQYQSWLKGQSPKKSTGRRGKFNNNAGPRADLGHHCMSSLEANTERLLRFLEYSPWAGEGEPPADGHWYVYERQKLRLVANAGKQTERPVFYLPDFWLWNDGAQRIWEAKGQLDHRSKRLLRLMALQYPDLPVDLITYEELQDRKAEVLYAARRRGQMVLDIDGWE